MTPLRVSPLKSQFITPHPHTLRAHTCSYAPTHIHTPQHPDTNDTNERKKRRRGRDVKCNSVLWHDLRRRECVGRTIKCARQDSPVTREKNGRRKDGRRKETYQNEVLRKEKRERGKKKERTVETNEKQRRRRGEGRCTIDQVSSDDVREQRRCPKNCSKAHLTLADQMCSSEARGCTKVSFSKETSPFGGGTIIGIPQSAGRCRRKHHRSPSRALQRLTSCP